MSNIIQLRDIARYIIDADVVKINGPFQMTADVEWRSLFGEPEHEFLTVSCDYSHAIIRHSFLEGMNQTVEVDGHEVMLIDSHGMKVYLLLYVLQRMDWIEPRDPFSGALSS